MKLDQNTQILVLLAVILSGGIFGHEIITDRQATIIQKQQKQIFQFERADISKIVIDKSQQTLELVQTDRQAQPWQLKQPEDTPANDGRVAFLLDLLTNGEPKHSFLVKPNQLAQYGLERPWAKITILLDNNQTYQITLGKPGIEPDTIYAQVISPLKNLSQAEVLLVPKNWQNAVEPELAAWKLENSK